MPNTANIQLAALSIIISLAGCAIDESGLDLGVNGYDLNATNGLPINGLPINGLPINGLPINGLPINGLADASVETDLDAWLNDPTYGAAHNTLMRYMVRCALPAGTDSSFVDSADHTWIWYGEIGLAPSWANGSMTAAEKRWVSSCVTSLVNGLALHVQVSQRGPSTSRYEYSAYELANWDLPEGAFFGDLFGSTPLFYSCSASNNYQDPGNGRICTMTDENDESMCGPVQALGLCADICDSEVQQLEGQTFTTYHNCEAPDGTIFAEVTTVNQVTTVNP